jgi:hypothetical protein
MSDFVRVLGDDPEEKGRKSYIYVHRLIIYKIYPIWGVEKDGRWFSCTATHPDAKVMSCRLIDVQGKFYSCGKIEELKKLLSDDEISRLFGKAPERRRIGFEGSKEQYEVDPIDGADSPTSGAA